MSAYHLAPRLQPVLRRQRLVRFDEATTLVGQASSRIALVQAVAGPALPSPFLEKQVWLAVEANRLLREAQSLLEAEHAPTAAQEVLRLVQELMQELLGDWWQAQTPGSLRLMGCLLACSTLPDTLA